MRELVDERDLRTSRKDGFDVHLFEAAAFVLHLPAWDNFEIPDLLLRLASSVCLNDPDCDVFPVFLTPPSFV